MVPETHRIIAGELREHLLDTAGVVLDESKLMRGSIAPDIYPKYKFIPHYYDESIDYIVEAIVSMIPYMSEIVHHSAWARLLIHPMSYKIGVISHYLADYMTHPHARRIRCTSMKDLKDHLLYERELNSYVKNHRIDRDLALSLDDISFSGNSEDLREFIKESIFKLVESYLEKDITFKNDSNSAFHLNAYVFNVMCQASYSYGLEKQVQMA